MSTLLLLVPPFTDASQPGAAVPSLIAAVEGCGIGVEAWDVNLDAWEYLLDPGRQTRWLARAGRSLAALERRRALGRAERRVYASLAEGWLRGSAAHQELDRAVAVLRSPSFYDARAYRRAMQAIEGALALVSAVFYPSRLEWGRFWPAASVASSLAITRMARSRRYNPFLAFAVQRLGPRVRALAPAIIGISVTYLDQVVPAFTLAAECKRAVPGSTVVMGGQIPSLWGDALLEAAPLWRHVDVFVRGDGEEALRAILRAHLRGQPCDGIPGVAVRGRGYGKPMVGAMDALPCPDYRNLPLGRYLAPEPVLTLAASRGCYWGRCAFCAVSPAFRGGFRARSAERIREDLRLLAQRHRTRCLFFADDALPRSVIRSLARDGTGTAERLHWQAELRWDGLREDEVEGLARSGARNLVFGLESGSERLLRRMRKGARLDHALKLVARCAKEGVGVNLQCFLGFPGETRADAAATLRFLEQARGAGITVSCGLFELQKGSPVWRDPAAFGVRIRRAGSADDLATRFEYEPQRGRRRRLALIDRIRRGFEPAAPQLRCGIHAHALLYLSSGDGVAPPSFPVRLALNEPLSAAPGSAHRVFPWDPFSLADKPCRQPTALAFSLERPTCASIGRVGAAILRACDGRTRAADLLATLPRPARDRVHRVLRQLARRGLIAFPGPDGRGL